MNKYMSTSLIFKSSDSLYQYFLASYCYKLLHLLLNWCKQSKTNRLISKFLQNSSTLEYSMTYRICSRVISAIGKLLDRIYGFTTNCFKTSLVLYFIRNTFCSKNSFIAYSIFILFFSCGFGVTSILLGSFNKISALLLVIGLLLSSLLLVEKSSWLAGLKGSLFWRIALYVFDIES